MADELTARKSRLLRMRDYFAEVRVEMKRVTWPSKQEIYGTTLMVVLTTFLFGIYFWVVDQGFSHLVSVVLRFFLGRG